MEKDLRKCVYWLSSTGDLDYAVDCLKTAFDYFDEFNNFNGLDPKFAESINSIITDFRVLFDKYDDIYDRIFSLIDKIKSLQDGQVS